MFFYEETDRLQLIESKLSLVSKVVFDISGSIDIADDLDDLFQIGCVGLIKAINQYNKTTTTDFDQFAVTLIQAEIEHYVKIANQKTLNTNEETNK